MLTGSPKGSPDEKGLNRIISKAASFAPENRYQSAAALRRALSRYLSQVKPKIIMAVIIAATFFIVFSAGYFTGRFTTAAVKDVYHFTEPLIEEAVRAQLGIDDGRMITKDDLQNIEVLAVTGLDVLPIYGDMYDAEYDSIIVKYISPDNPGRGNIRSLDDIAMMSNIKRLALLGQQINRPDPVKRTAAYLYKFIQQPYLGHIRVALLFRLAGYKYSEYRRR
jgi:hypothetical protein